MFRFQLLSSFFIFYLIGCGSHESVRLPGVIAKTGGTVMEDSSPAGVMSRAISSNNLPQVKEMVESGFALETPLPRGNSPLLEAVEWNRRQITEYLMEKGADPLFKNPEGKNAFDLAANKPNVEQVLRPELRAEWEGELFAAIQADDFNKAKTALELKYVDPNILDATSGETPLTFSIRSKKMKVIRVLFQSRSADHLKVDFNKPNRTGETPLKIARQMKSAVIEKELLKNGAKE